MVSSPSSSLFLLRRPFCCGNREKTRRKMFPSRRFSCGAIGHLRRFPEFLDLLVGLVLHLLHFFRGAVAGLGGLSAGFVLRCILNVAPYLFRRAFYLIGDAAVGKALVIEGSPHFLLYLAGCLVHFAADVVFIHRSSFLDHTGLLPVISWMIRTTSAMTRRIWMYQPIA